jgi:hypothetical protein
LGHKAAVKYEYDHGYLLLQHRRPSVRLNSSKSQHLLCDLWFLKWLGAVVWVFLAIADWDTGFADVAVSFVSKLGMSESFIGGLTSGASEWCLARS